MIPLKRLGRQIQESFGSIGHPSFLAGNPVLASVRAIPQIDKMFNLCIRSFMSRLSIEIDPDQHRQIKTLATFAGMSLKDYILARTLPAKSAETDSTEKLLSSPQNAKRLRAAVNAPASEHVVFESLKDLKNALGI
jgi:uncharacterized protein (DUF1778 family)